MKWFPGDIIAFSLVILIFVVFILMAVVRLWVGKPYPDESSELLTTIITLTLTGVIGYIMSKRGKDENNNLNN